MQHEYDYTATLAGGIELQLIVRYTKHDGKAIDVETIQVLPDGTENEIFPAMPDLASIIGDVEMSNQFAEA